MNIDKLSIRSFLNRSNGILAKTLLAFLLVIVFASVHFAQRYGWTQATGRQLLSKDVWLLYMGYLLLGVFSFLIFWFHHRLPLLKAQLKRNALGHIVAALVFALLHNLAFSIIYYLLNPAWQEYSFFLLFKDIALNYFNTGLFFYLGALLFSEVYNTLLTNSQEAAENNAILKVKDQSRTYLFQLNDIAYFTSADNYVKVHCGEQTVLMRESMSSLEKRLDSNIFFRVHRTALINKNFISQIVKAKGETKLVMKDETVLPISRRRKEAMALLESAI